MGRLITRTITITAVRSTTTVGAGMTQATVVIQAVVTIKLLPPNQRMKLAWRGGRLKGNGSVLMAAAAPRSLCAIR